MRTPHTLTELLATMPTPERPNAFADVMTLYLVYEDIDDLGNRQLAFTTTDSTKAARLAEGLGLHGASGAIETTQRAFISIDGTRFHAAAMPRAAQRKRIAAITAASVASRMTSAERKLMRDHYKQESRS